MFFKKIMLNFDIIKHLTECNYRSTNETKHEILQELYQANNTLELINMKVNIIIIMSVLGAIYTLFSWVWK